MEVSKVGSVSLGRFPQNFPMDFKALFNSKCKIGTMPLSLNLSYSI